MNAHVYAFNPVSHEIFDEMVLARQGAAIEAAHSRLEEGAEVSLIG